MHEKLNYLVTFAPLCIYIYIYILYRFIAGIMTRLNVK